jgi:hypothetical protein
MPNAIGLLLKRLVRRDVPTHSDPHVVEDRRSGVDRRSGIDRRKEDLGPPREFRSVVQGRIDARVSVGADGDDLRGCVTRRAAVLLLGLL